MRVVAVLLTLSLCLRAQTAVGLAEAALDRAAFPEAIRIAETALRHEPGNAAAHVLLARASMGQNQPAKAFAVLRVALQLDPRNLDALYYLHRLTSVLAQQEFARLYAMAPDSARVHQLMAESLHEQNDAAGEEREYLAALERNPKSVVILNAMGDLKRHQSKLEEARGFYARAEAVDHASFDALYGLGACAIFMQDNERAIGYLTGALHAEPESIAAKLALGDALLRAKQNQRAEEVLRGLVKSDPAAKQGWVLYAKALRLLGRKEEADRAFARYRALSRGETDEK